MDNERKQLLVQIMAEEFTAVELNLFLDTHPEDRKALSDFNETVKKLNQFKAQYEQKYGPLTNFGYVTSEYPWHWVDEPWPWEINFAV
ncbi:MAG: spore coat protein CotJB [Chitinophagales bacterium]